MRDERTRQGDHQPLNMEKESLKQHVIIHYVRTYVCEHEVDNYRQYSRHILKYFETCKVSLEPAEIGLIREVVIL